MPLEKPSQRSLAWGTEPEPADQFVRPRFGNPGLDAPQAGDEFEIFGGRELVVDHRLVRDPRHDALGFDRIGERVDAEHRDRALVGRKQPRDHAQGRGLAGAIRSEQTVEFAGAHGQVEAVDRGAGRSAW
jgi:hypothetical protein